MHYCKSLWDCDVCQFIFGAQPYIPQNFNQKQATAATHSPHSVYAMCNGYTLCRCVRRLTNEKQRKIDIDFTNQMSYQMARIQCTYQFWSVVQYWRAVQGCIQDKSFVTYTVKNIPFQSNQVPFYNGAPLKGKNLIRYQREQILSFKSSPFKTGKKKNQILVIDLIFV